MSDYAAFRANFADIPMLPCGRVRVDLMDGIEAEVRQIVNTHALADMTDPGHPSNWSNPYGRALQCSLYNSSNDPLDFSSDHNLSQFDADGAAKHFVFPELTNISRFFAVFEPFAINFRLNGLGPGSGLSPHREYPIHGDRIRIRLHLPVITNEDARLVLGDRAYHFERGIIYFFNQGWVHDAFNRGGEIRYHLVWDSWLDERLYNLMTRGDQSIFASIMTEEVNKLSASKPFHIGSYSDQFAGKLRTYASSTSSHPDGTQGASHVIGGHFGFGNLGDEAILQSMVEQLRATHPDRRVVVLSAEPEVTAQRLGVESTGWTDLPGIVQAVANCEQVVIGGGGIFHDYSQPVLQRVLTEQHRGLEYFGGLACLSWLLEKPYALHAVGVGPLTTQEGIALTSFAFRHAVRTSVRDADSLTVLDAVGIPVTDVEIVADPAVVISPNNEAADRALRSVELSPEEPLVAVCLRDWTSASGSDWRAEVAASLDEFVEQCGATVLFIPFQERDSENTTDEAVADAVCARMRHGNMAHVVRARLEPAAAAGVLAACELVVAMRLHSAIFAAAVATPLVGIVYDAKVASFLKMSGLESYGLEFTQLARTPLFELMKRTWLSRDGIREHLAKWAKSLRPAELFPGETGSAKPAAIISETDALLLRRISLNHVQAHFDTARTLDEVRERVRRGEEAVGHLQGTVNEQVDWNLKLRAQVAERDAEIARLMSLLDGQTRWNLQLKAQLAEHNAVLQPPQPADTAPEPATVEFSPPKGSAAKGRGTIVRMLTTFARSARSYVAR